MVSASRRGLFERAGWREAFYLGHDVEFVLLRLVRGVVLFLEKKIVDTGEG
jgi:hypothetical protein